MTELGLDHFKRTPRGNGDAFGIYRRGDSTFVAAFDGVGSGMDEEASQWGVQSFQASVMEGKSLRQAFEAANTKLFSENLGRFLYGTAALALQITDKQEVTIATVGDLSIYLIRRTDQNHYSAMSLFYPDNTAGNIIQPTGISPEYAYLFGGINKLWSDLGFANSLDFKDSPQPKSCHVGPLTLPDPDSLRKPYVAQTGDRLLVMSDGAEPMLPPALVSTEMGESYGDVSIAILGLQRYLREKAGWYADYVVPLKRHDPDEETQNIYALPRVRLPNDLYVDRHARLWSREEPPSGKHLHVEPDRSSILEVARGALSGDNMTAILIGMD